VKVLFLSDWLLLPGEYDDNYEDHRQKEDKEGNNVNRDFRCRVDWFVAVPLVASVIAIFDAVAFFGHVITFESVKAPVWIFFVAFNWAVIFISSIVAIFNPVAMFVTFYALAMAARELVVHTAVTNVWALVTSIHAVFVSVAEIIMLDTLF